MKNFLLIILVSFIAGILESTIFIYLSNFLFSKINLFSFTTLKINIALTIILYISFKFQILEGSIFSIVVGYIMDNFYPSSFGLYTFIYLVIYLLARTVFQKIYFVRFELIMFYALLFSLIESIMIIITLSATGSFRDFSFYKIIIPEAIISAIFSPVVFTLLNFCFSIAGVDKKSGWGD